MAYTQYTAAQAVTRANVVTRYLPAGMCLEFTRTCLNGATGVGLYDANAAWRAARQKEYGTPPAGAPVYFAGYEHGHISLSLGGGFVRSTDVPDLTYVGRINIGDLERSWGIKYLGWSRDYAGLLIRGLEKTSTVYSPPPVTIPEDDMFTDADRAALNAARADAYAAHVHAKAANANAEQVEDVVRAIRSEEAARYQVYVGKLNEILNGGGTAAQKVDALKALLPG